MKHRSSRKTTPKVVGGKVLKKNNHKLTPNYWNTAQKEIQIDEEKPGKGYKHFLKKRDIHKFIKLIPNWEVYSNGLDAILLCQGGYDYDGLYYTSGIICLAAWDKNLDISITADHFHYHKKLYDRLKLKYTRKKDSYVCEFNVDQIKAYQLLHVFLHELGHHYDKMKTKSQNNCVKGEEFANKFAFEHEKEMWNKYEEAFNVVL